MRKIVIRSPPQGTVRIDENAPAIHAIGRQTVGAVQSKPVGCLGLRGIGDVDTLIGSSPQSAVMVQVKRIATRVGHIPATVGRPR